MAIIYTYPVKTTPNANDLILISDSQDSNKTKQVKISTLPGGSGSGVSSVSSANAAITVADATTTPVLTSIAYSGGTNIGHVPTGGSNTTFLRGDGTWVVPTNTTDITLTTTGTSGAATWNGTTLNIPQYSGGATPGTPLNSVQFNNAGAFSGSSSLLFSNNKLSVTHAIDVKGDGTNAGKINLYCQNTSVPHAVTIEGPDHANAAAYTLKLPSPAPTSNQILEYQDSTNNLRWINTPTSGTTYSAGDGLGLSGSTFSADVKENGGITIESARLALDLGGSSITGTLAITDGGTGSSQAEYCDLTTNVTGILPVSNGGTGVATLGANRLILGNGANAVTSLSSQTKGTIVVGDGATTNILGVGTNGHVLTAASAEATGVRWTAPTVAASNITGTLPVTNGGSGSSTAPAAAGSISFANSYQDGYDTSTQLKYDQNTLSNVTTSTTTPAIYLSSANATTVGGAGAYYAGGIGAVNIQNTSSTNNSVPLVVSASAAQGGAANVSRLITFYGGSSGGPGSFRCGDLFSDSSALSMSLSNASDYRLKENVSSMTGSTVRIKALNPISYNMIGQTKTVEGFLAHELQDQFPNAVIGVKDAVDEEGNIQPQMVDYTKIIPALVGTIKELTARIEALEA